MQRAEPPRRLGLLARGPARDREQLRLSLVDRHAAHHTRTRGAGGARGTAATRCLRPPRLSATLPAVALQGDLKTYPLVDLLQWLDASRKPGQLSISVGDGERRILLTPGTVARSGVTGLGER
ncbi:MAG: DUF4388 domain-containing protein, partial [Myxococcales bacterium]